MSPPERAQAGIGYVEGELPERDFDVVVVGSGFGGSVAAYELAGRGERVCVLERGKAFPPGSFPRTPADFSKALWDPDDGTHGMFNIWSFQGIEAVTASGLGGGSLIYANVLLRKDPAWFRQHHPYDRNTTEAWPIGYEDLEPHYAQIEEFLRLQTVPEAAGLPKIEAMRIAALRLGRSEDFHLAPLAVRFRGPGGSFNPSEPLEPEDYPNIHGLPGLTRRTCELCGACDIGCNTGAKNTLDHTYLSAAAAQDALISTRSQVTSLRRTPQGFEVDFVVHAAEDEGRPTDTRWLPVQTVRARRVVLAAGSLGSTYLLLRNRTSLGLSTPALGTRFSGNGDLLGFLVKSTDAGRPRHLEGSYGPVIGSYIRFPDWTDTADPADLGMYLEDAGYPAFLQWLVESTQVGGLTRRAVGFGLATLRQRLRKDRDTVLSDEMKALIGDSIMSQTSLPLLGMGRDVPDGRLFLSEEDRAWLECSWRLDTSEDYFELLKDRMAQVSEALCGRFLVNPQFLLRRVVSVHPLGGAPMGNHPDQGVVDRYGQVHGVPGLYVADGAVMPGPVGANPSLTIAAFARWMVEHAEAQGAGQS